jgi:hypothetical protein
LAEAREQLPDPVYDARPVALEAYWKAWACALASMRTPEPGSGLVSTHLAFTFNDPVGGAIFAHDSAMMTLFARFGWRLFPFIETLDNFYARQHDTGEICREIDRRTGVDCWPNDEGDPMTVRLEGPWERHGGDWSKVDAYKWHRPSINRAPPARCRVDAYTDHKFHWAEWETYLITGDLRRLARVIEPLERLHDAFSTYLQDTNGLYITDWAGMDNSPRNAHLGYGVDLSAQMAGFAATLGDMHAALGNRDSAASWHAAAELQRTQVRRLLWNEVTGLFHDLRFDGSLAPVKTVMGFAPLRGCRPTPEQCARMVEHLHNPATFNRPVPIPSLAADEPDYRPEGEYYLGGVWPYTNAMVFAGLEECGHGDLAGSLARRYWQAAVTIYEQTGTFWEYLAPERAAPGRGTNPADSGKNARPDFAGWGVYPVIAVFLEHVIGLRADAPSGTLTWNLTSTARCGCLRFAFGPVVTDLVVAPRASPDEEPRLETTRTNHPFTLDLRWGEGQRKRYRVEPDDPPEPIAP